MKQMQEEQKRINETAKDYCHHRPRYINEVRLKLQRLC